MTETTLEPKDKVKDKVKAMRILIALQESDRVMARFVEDIIKALLRKGILSEADIPAVVRDSMSQREQLRQNLHDLESNLAARGDKVPRLVVLTLHVP